jgi:hypothetical protein
MLYLSSSTYPSPHTLLKNTLLVRINNPKL